MEDIYIVIDDFDETWTVEKLRDNLKKDLRAKLGSFKGYTADIIAQFPELEGEGSCQEAGINGGKIFKAWFFDKINGTKRNVFQHLG